MLLSTLRRKCGLHVALRYKFLLGFAVFILFAWTQLGPLRKRSESSERNPVAAAIKSHLESKQDNSETVVKKGKGREYLDFDYKYDLKRLKVGEDIPEESDNVNKLDNNIDLPDTLKDDSQLKLILPPSKENRPSHDFNRGKPRRNMTLNGVHLSANHDEFDVVGSIDLFPLETLKGGYDEFAEDDKLVVAGAGENGEPVSLSPEEAARGEKVMAKEAFNLVASDKMSLRRVVPDTRDPKCRDVTYDKDLPTTSVVIIYTNEAWTPLLRTIWSVLDKTPPEYLHEIILVDDFSDKKYLKGKLERYIQKKFPSKVRLKRLSKRSGLIRARLTGAKLATGDVLVFLDSHCECGQDWLQPLLHRIKEEPKAFVVPIIDVIDDKTMEYYHGNGIYFQIGGFTWNGHFNWIDIPEHENTRRGSAIAPTRTPTMAGGLFAVDRNYFWEIGSYDEAMDVWGGENLEMSFRVWQCGGLLETIPCSRVGHIFRSFHPYTFPGHKDTHGINTARTVEVWMEEYKRLFYMNRPDLVTKDIGNVTARLQFKEEKHCKSFKWYLDNVFPQKFILDDPDHVFSYGRVRNPVSSMCFDTLQRDEKETYNLGIYPCHNYVAASQFYSFSKKYELRREDACAEIDALAGAGTETVRMAPCHGQGTNQEWIHTKQGRLIHKATNKCLDSKDGGETVLAAPCKAVQTQIWFFDNYIS